MESKDRFNEIFENVPFLVVRRSIMWVFTVLSLFALMISFAYLPIDLFTMLQLIALCMLYYSIQVREVAVAVMVLLVTIYNFPIHIIRRISFMWYAIASHTLLTCFVDVSAKTSPNL